MNSRLRMTAACAIALAMLQTAAGAAGTECALNGNPACVSAINLGTISGDADSQGITRVGTGEAFFTVQVQETSGVHPRPLNARVTLQVPPQVDYDLIVRCTSCVSPVAFTAKQGFGATEVIDVTRADTFAENTFAIVIEIRHFAGSGCGQWKLTINGNTPTAKTPLSCA